MTTPLEYVITSRPKGIVSVSARTGSTVGPGGWRTVALLSLMMLGAAIAEAFLPSSLGAGTESVAPDTSTRHDGVSSTITLLEARAARAEREASDLVRIHEGRLEPLVRMLDEWSWGPVARLDRVALALMREGWNSGVDPRLLLSVLLVENPWLDPAAESPAGAIGLMQVMPFHAGRWGCPGSDLTNPEDNICHGARILAEALRKSGGDLDGALLRYNGCVPGVSNSDCLAYPSWVYRSLSEGWITEIVASLQP
jgi:soluble lytic murein transglycosylase-like protein